MVATAMTVANNRIPPTVNFTGPGEGCDLDYVPNNARDLQVGVALTNAFAFGGLNAVIALKSWASDN
jgi:3-oxoacyl-(acyl-carrier-protein) synthase